MMEMYLFLPFPVIHHPMLCSHGIRFVKRGWIEWHFLDLGDFVRHISLSHTFRLVHVAPELEELFEKRSLSILRYDLDLGVFWIAHFTYKVRCNFHPCTSLFFISILSCFFLQVFKKRAMV